VIRLLRGSPHLPTPISGIGDEFIFVGAKSGGSVKGKGRRYFHALANPCNSPAKTKGPVLVAWQARMPAAKTCTQAAGCSCRYPRLGGERRGVESLEVWSLWGWGVQHDLPIVDPISVSVRDRQA
jgi:hypothetical protein